MTRTKSIKKLAAMIVCVAMLFSLLAIGASAQTLTTGTYVNDTTGTDASGSPIYFYAVNNGQPGAAAPHGNNVVNSYDIIDNGDGTFGAVIYFQTGHVQPYPGSPNYTVIVENFETGGDIESLFDVSEQTATISDITAAIVTDPGSADYGRAVLPVILSFEYPELGSHPGGQNFFLKLDHFDR